ncbi:hypothetical protein AAG570_003133 [Ranatra chinensis]|uniref:Uracil-DNA glycosylase-like domain-containing protein n=1 Tax=Ranatra chinensis TaxID=642074 RepID=A0ABD0Y6C6_9HEMI
MHNNGEETYTEVSADQLARYQTVNIFPELILQIELKLSRRLRDTDFGPSVEYVYDPLTYAYDIHSKFVRKFCLGTKEILFLGMNPGPWGMMQNGVPFGENTSVQQFLGLFGTVVKPEREHPLRPVLGLACRRSEVSGKRFWSLARLLGASEAEVFFRHCFVYNYFPLCLIGSHGKNVTPPELKAAVQRSIESACDSALCEVISLLNVKVVIGIGRFSEKKALNVVSRAGLNDVKVLFLPHPSPRNPATNKDWLTTTKQLIIDYDLAQYFAI